MDCDGSCTRQAEGESLPPTSGSLKPHIMRANYIAMVWLKACESHPSLPSPVDCGWKLDNGRFVPVRCVNAPAPEALIKLVKYGCKKGCKETVAVATRNNNIPCKELCGCSEYECSNNIDRTLPIVDDADEDC